MLLSNIAEVTHDVTGIVAVVKYSLNGVERQCEV